MPEEAHGAIGADADEMRICSLQIILVFFVEVFVVFVVDV